MKYTKVGNVKDPIGNRKEDSGVDVYTPNDWNDGKPYVLRMNEQVNIPSQIKVKIKNTQSFIAFNKSGVSLKKGLVQGACVIDAGYTGILHCNLLKAAKGTEDIRVRRRGILGWLGFKEWATIINPGEKITQFILVNISNEPIEQISNKEYEKGPKTKRGSGAFGSTGTK
jgi:dUTPase